MSGLNSMNLGGDNSLPQHWSPETEKCLVDLNMILMGYDEAARTLKLPGVGDMYSKLQELIGEINRGGPAVMEKYVDQATKQATTVYQALNSAKREEWGF